MLAREAYDALTVLAPATGGRYAEAVVGQPSTLNPLLAQIDPIDRELMPLLFAGLTRLAPDGQVLPDLAERWDASPDARSYTFVLRPGLRWSDGAPLEAADVVFTYEALRAPDFPSDADLLAPWREVTAEAVDARTVRVTLGRPWAGFLEAATLGIVPRHVLAGASGRGWRELDFNRAPVGAGPYRLLDLTVQELVLAPNPNYYGPRPYLAEVRLRFYETPAAAQDALLAGEVDGLALPASSALDALRAVPTLVVQQRPDYARTTLLWLNTAAAPFDDRAVRTASALAIDRARLLAEVGGGAAPALSALPPASWAYAADATLPAYAPERARAVLDGAGWRVGANGERARAGTPLAFTLLTNDDPARRRAADAVARDLRAVGFRVQVSVRDWAALARDELAQRRYQAVVLGQWQPLGDPDGLNAIWRSDGVGNLANWKNPRADELLAQADATTDLTARRAAYTAFQKLWAEETPSVPLYYPSLTWALRAELQGVDLAHLGEAAPRLAQLPAWYLRTARVFRGW